MSKNESALFSLTDEMTPKVDEGEVAFELRSRDYKNPQVVVFRKTAHPQTPGGGRDGDKRR